MRSKAFHGVLAAALAVAMVAIPALEAAGAERSARDDPPARTPSRERSAAKPKRPAPPEPMVLQFKYISAESFMRTLSQLAEHPRVDAMLRDLPKALNEEANAVVICAAPQVAARVRAIARRLDQPNEFEQRRRRQRMFRLRMERAGRERAAPPARGLRRARAGMERAGREQAAPPRAKSRTQPKRGARPEKLSAHARKAAPAPGAHIRMHGQPMPDKGLKESRSRSESHSVQGRGGLWTLLSPKAVKELGLSEAQVKKIKAILAEQAETVRRMMERLQNAVKDTAPEQRRQRMREMMENLAKRRAERMKQIRSRAMKVLTPAQRGAAEKMLRGPRPAPSEKPPKAARPKRPVLRPGDSAAEPSKALPAVQETPVRFFLV